jgi:hypothetical protein
MKEKVLEYIDYLKSEIDHEPQCFMVSLLLLTKFPEGKIYYDNNHMIIKIGDQFYDWRGIVTEDERKRHSPFPEGWGDNWIVAHYKAIFSRFKDLMK